jgi:hypothetical protein
VALPDVTERTHDVRPNLDPHRHLR